MKKIFLFTLLAAGVLSASAAKKIKKVELPQTTAIELKSGSDSISYAAGYSLTEGLIPYLQQQFKVDTAYMADFIQGLKDARDKANDPRFVAYQAGGQIASMIKDRMIAGISGELQDTPDSLVADLFYEGFFASLQKDTAKFTQANAQQFFTKRMEQDKAAKDEKLYGENKRKGIEFLAANAKKDSVVTTPSGLQYKVLVMGNGPKPTSTQEVQVKYEGHLIDGTEFDSSYKRSDPITKFKANQVIKGWTEALTMMPVGSKWEVYVPQELGYGSQNMGKIPPYSTLIFTVELVDITGVTDVEAAEEPAKATAKKAPAKKKK